LGGIFLEDPKVLDYLRRTTGTRDVPVGHLSVNSIIPREIEGPEPDWRRKHREAEEAYNRAVCKQMQSLME
jgi:hypothetical protein